ncbi:MAG: hypothetical protein HQ582_22525, partial [Planctomycetes bacterium]|nr:hypothetical protein [Planctomycetota bacterium]
MTKKVLTVGHCSFDHGTIERLILAHFDADMAAASSHEEALEMLRRGHFDLALVNRKLAYTGADGVELIEKIKADPRLADRRVMLVSNYPEAQQAAVAVGAEPGFGKARLDRPETVDTLARFLRDETAALASEMNPRERFLATMRFQPRDRSPICDFSFWEETIEAWYEQGLPRNISRAETDDYFGMDPLFRCVADIESSALTAPADPARSVFDGLWVGLVPPFEPVVLETRGDGQVVQQCDGVRVFTKTSSVSIPLTEQHLLVDRQSWREHYLPRLDPDDPRRYPENWDACVALWRDESRQLPVFLPGGSFYGWIRNWMGLEALSLAVYDDPAWFEEMVTAVADCVIGVLERVLETGGRFDGCSLWEDMCYNNGPLLGPTQFKRFLVPHYRRLTDLLRRHGVDVIWVDCDGQIDELLPLWLD